MIYIRDLWLRLLASSAPTEFIKAWQTIHDAVKDIEGCLMFWSPNNAKTIEALNEWWAGSDYVDIVGVDLYISSNNTTFANAYVRCFR
jgi:beta-mannanase